MKLASPIRPAGLNKYGNFSPVGAPSVSSAAQTAHDAAVAAFGSRRPAGKAAGALPEVLNVTLLYLDARGRTHNESAWCDAPSLVTRTGVLGSPVCMDRNGTIIPVTSILSGFPHADETNPVYAVPTPYPRPGPGIPPAPQNCPAIPARITSQDDIDTWNRLRPAGCDPLPPFTTICAVPSPYPTTQTEADAWHAEHPQCPTVTPQPAKRSWLGPAALAAAAVVAVVIVTRK